MIKLVERWPEMVKNGQEMAKKGSGNGQKWLQKVKVRAKHGKKIVERGQNVRNGQKEAKKWLVM